MAQSELALTPRQRAQSTVFPAVFDEKQDGGHLASSLFSRSRTERFLLVPQDEGKTEGERFAEVAEVQKEAQEALTSI